MCVRQRQRDRRGVRARVNDEEAKVVAGVAIAYTKSTADRMALRQLRMRTISMGRSEIVSRRFAVVQLEVSGACMHCVSVTLVACVARCGSRSVG